MEQDNSHGDTGGSTPSPNTPSCLVDQFPEVAAEWHPTRNGERSPSWVTPGSKYRAWWLCSVCGSEWQARVGSRTRGHGCPSCGRELAGRSHAVPKPGTSLAEWFPDVAAEWHPTRNGDLTPDLVGYASNKKVWWRSRDCQHEWQIQVSNRSRGSSCRRCAHRALGAPKPGNSLLERFPSISAEWHPSRNEAATPAGTSYGAKRRVWWQMRQLRTRVVSRRLQQNQWRYRLSCMRKRIKPETARTSPPGGRPGWCFGAGRLRG
jgi:DNA-directed RNA polymerase subunit RPC12/RpoP